MTIDQTIDLTFGGSFLPQHVAKLKSSAVSADTKLARGYQTVTELATLERAGFTKGQRRVPGILIPLHGVDGRTAGYQYRPDEPRVFRGRTIKYDSPKGQRMVLDVPPACHQWLDYPATDLWVTEGPIKADAAATAGLCCIALLGVSSWRGTNRDGGKAALPDWEQIALNGRRVVLAFDSDALDNPMVWDALKRLGEFLSRRDAKVGYLRLPAAPDGSKVGLDDALASGMTIEQLEQLVADSPGRRPVPDATDPVGPDGFRYTDVGNADRLVAQHGDQIRYVDSWNSWLAWDGTRWATDPRSVRVIELAKDVPRQLWKASPDLTGDERSRQIKWATHSERAPTLDAMVKLARGSMAISHNDLDQYHWELNCENGAVDLTTGQLRDHDPERMATKLAPVRYDPNATAPTWDGFLRRIMPDDDLRRYLQVAVGYALTGDVGEQVLFLLIGDGANGKSTFLTMVTRMLGDYAATAPKDLLLATRHEPHPTGLTVLHGARFVSAVETEANQKLAEAQVKQLTGGDTITARRMRQDFWDFSPTHKIFLAANHKPRIAGEDHAIWRRLRLVPFAETIPEDEQDPQLVAKLTDELPGILTWAVQGCLRWQSEGLQTPDVVSAAVAAYRTDEDWLQRFVEDKELILGHGGSMPTAKLQDLYRAWTQETGEQHVGTKAFGNKLRLRGAEPIKINGYRAWKGVIDDSAPT